MSLESVFTVINVLTAIVAVASAVSALTPTTKDDAFIAKIKPYVDIFALNIRNARK